MSASLSRLSQVPMLVQIQQKWRRIYAGECQGPGVRTDFEIVHLRKVPSQYNHLSGLLDIFKSKIVSVVSSLHVFTNLSVNIDLSYYSALPGQGCNLLPLPPVDIAIRFTYILQDWQQYSWPQQPPGELLNLSESVPGSARPVSIQSSRFCGMSMYGNTSVKNSISHNAPTTVVYNPWLSKRWTQ